MKLTLKKTALAAVAATTLFSFAACGGSSSAGGSGSGDGGKVTFLIDALDVFKTNSSAWSNYEGHVYRNVFDKLVYVDADGKANPWIAESWENNSDYTQFTLHLKSGVTFSDGEKLDAAAVVKNLDFWAKGDESKGIAPVGLFPKTYKSATAVDDTTVQVNFSAPTLGFIPSLGYSGSALYAPKSIDASAQDQADLSKQIGSGPYTVKSWKIDDNVVLVKRPDYNWGPEASGNSGPAHIDQITFKMSTDPSVRVAAVQSHQADIATNPTPQQIADVKQAGFNVVTPVYVGFSYGWTINASLFPTNSAAVRQALQHAIDRDEILSTVYTDDWKPAISVFNANVPGVADVSADFKYDPELSAKLLADDGWKKNSDGVLAKDGKELELTLYTSPYVIGTKQMDQLISTQLGKLGIKTNIVAYDITTFNEKLVSGPRPPVYELSRSFGDASTAANVFSGADKGEDWFGLGTSDKTIEKLRPEIIGATSPEARNKALAELQKYVVDQGYYIPIYQMVQRSAVTSPDLKDIGEDANTFVAFNTATLD